MKHCNRGYLRQNDSNSQSDADNTDDLKLSGNCTDYRQKSSLLLKAVERQVYCMNNLNNSGQRFALCIVSIY